MYPGIWGSDFSIGCDAVNGDVGWSYCVGPFEGYCLRLTINHASPTIAAIAATPPTVPPTIAPTGTLLADAFPISVRHEYKEEANWRLRTGDTVELLLG